MDQLLFDAIESILESGIAAKSFLQRKFRIGYEHASKLIHIIEVMEIIGPEIPNQPRQIKITLDDWVHRMERKEKIEDCIHQVVDEKLIPDKFELQLKPIEAVWEKTLCLLRAELTENTFNTWFRDVSAIYSGNRILLITLNDFHREVIENRYISLIKHIMEQVVESNLEIEIITADKCL